MSAATVSINKKLADGTLVSIGGTSYDDLYQNLLSLNGGDVVATEAAFAEARAAFGPVSAGAAPTYAAVAAGFAAPAPAPVAAPVAVAAGSVSPTCPTHGAAMTLQQPPPGKTYNAFFKCPITGGIVSEWGADPYKLKGYCPPPKARS